MKNLKFILFVVLPVLLVAGAIGFFGYGYFASGDMGDMSNGNLANAKTYRSGPFRVSVNINPTAPQVGNNQFTVQVDDASGNPVTGASIKAFGEMAAMSTMSAMRAPADLNEVEPGLYAGPLKLEMRGEWPLSLYIQKDGVGETRLGFDMATGREGLSINSGGTPVANAMASSSNDNMQTKGMAKGDDMMADGKQPKKNDLGFYTVGKYQIKVEVLGSGGMSPDDAMMQKHGMDSDMKHGDAMTKDASKSHQMSGHMAHDNHQNMSEKMPENNTDMNKGTALMSGENRLQVTVLDMDENPVNNAEVRVAAQLETDQGEHDSAMMQNEPMSGEDAMMDPSKHGDAMMQQDAMAHDHSAMAKKDIAQDGMMADSQPTKRNTEVMLFEPAGDGVYRGTLMLPTDGDYVLAVDVSTEENGHGDLVLAFTTGEYGLRSASATPEGIAYYTCAMHGSVREAGPGQCPICSMNLVPVTNEQVASGEVTVDARRRQLIGVETGKATVRDLSKTIRAVGQVDYDERKISNVTLKFDAWIGDLKADFVGTKVERGQTLFTVYSPELLSAQQEYLETRQRLASRGPDDSLVQAARRRLMLWDISAGQVRALERRGKALEYLPIAAPKSGTVVEKMIVEGSHMKTGDMLLRIADLSTVWVDAEVYEADLPLITEGMQAVVTLPYLAESRYEAKVDYIYPYLNPNTRTARIRLVLENPDGALKPDMYAEVNLQADLGRRLVVPEDAVLVSGESRVVFKDLGEGGRLKPVRVKTGQRVDGFIEITEGLSAGDSIITSGNFLIAAEAKLKTGIEQW